MSRLKKPPYLVKLRRSFTHTLVRHDCKETKDFASNNSSKLTHVIDDIPSIYTSCHRLRQVLSFGDNMDALMPNTLDDSETQYETTVYKCIRSPRASRVRVLSALWGGSAIVTQDPCFSMFNCASSMCFIRSELISGLKPKCLHLALWTRRRLEGCLH